MANEPTAAETNRPLKTAERDAQCAVDDLKQARRVEGRERTDCITSAKARLTVALETLNKLDASKSEG